MSRDGKTVGLSPHDCRRLLNAPEDKPELQTPVDCRDRALLAVLAYSGCRVGELVRLRVRDYKTSGEHRILNITGKGGKERTTPLHLEAVERLAAWLAVPGIKDDPAGPLFPAPRSPRGKGRDGFRREPMTTRAVGKLIDRYVTALGLDPNVTVHSLRVTALTTARERGSDMWASRCQTLFLVFSLTIVHSRADSVPTLTRRLDARLKAPSELCDDLTAIEKGASAPAA